MARRRRAPATPMRSKPHAARATTSTRTSTRASSARDRCRSDVAAVIPRTRLRSKTSRRGRPVGHFTQYRRLDPLRTAIETPPGGLSLDALAGSLHVTTRSVRRYLEELARITPLESVPTSPGGPHLWRIKPTERGRALFLRRTQAYGLLATRAVFEPLRG